MFNSAIEKARQAAIGNARQAAIKETGKQAVFHFAILTLNVLLFAGIMQGIATTGTTLAASTQIQSILIGIVAFSTLAIIASAISFGVGHYKAYRSLEKGAGSDIFKQAEQSKKTLIKKAKTGRFLAKTLGIIGAITILPLGLSFLPTMPTEISLTILSLLLIAVAAILIAVFMYNMQEKAPSKWAEGESKHPVNKFLLDLGNKAYHLINNTSATQYKKELSEALPTTTKDTVKAGGQAALNTVGRNVNAVTKGLSDAPGQIMGGVKSMLGLSTTSKSHSRGDKTQETKRR